MLKTQLSKSQWHNFLRERERKGERLWKNFDAQVITIGIYIRNAVDTQKVLVKEYFVVTIKLVCQQVCFYGLIVQFLTGKFDNSECGIKNKFQIHWCTCKRLFLAAASTAGCVSLLPLRNSHELFVNIHELFRNCS